MGRLSKLVADLFTYLLIYLPPNLPNNPTTVYSKVYQERTKSAAC